MTGEGFHVRVPCIGCQTPVLVADPDYPTPRCSACGRTHHGATIVGKLAPGAPTPTVQPATVRVLVTGSRDWADERAVWLDLHAHATHGGTLTVVHGDCPTGADRHARTWCERHAGWYREKHGTTVVEERHPADWTAPCRADCPPGHRRARGDSTYCPAAGNLRNQAMVDLGADHVHAYPLPGSRGTVHCITAAQAAGLDVTVHQPEGATP